MIANRFKSVGRVLAGAVAAMGLYLITSQVAAERTELERVNRQILAAKKDIRRLHTELGTRANLRQLERWNGEVLALTTPDADQFLQGEVQLAALDRSGITPGPRYAPTAMVTAMVAIPDASVVPEIRSDAVERPASAERRALVEESIKPEKKLAEKKAPEKAAAVVTPAKAEKAKPGAVKVEIARSEKPRAEKPKVDKAKADKEKKLARLEDKLLGDRLMGELTQKARAESGGRRNR